MKLAGGFVGFDNVCNRRYSRSVGVPGGRVMKILALVSVIIPCFGLTACVWDDMVGQVETSFTEPSSPVAVATPLVDSHPIPWQLTPASAASRAQGETTLLADVPKIGHVRGTEKAIAQWNQTIVPYAKDSKVVSACKSAFEPQAKNAGAYFVEAAAAGPKRKIASGWAQQVFFRILYADPAENGVEVRQASIDCTMDDSGKLKNANIV